MKAMRVEQTGGAEVLRLADVDDPRPGAGEAVVRLEAGGVNVIEVYQRTGLYPMHLPYTPGTEGAAPAQCQETVARRRTTWTAAAGSSS